MKLAKLDLLPPPLSPLLKDTFLDNLSTGVGTSPIPPDMSTRVLNVGSGGVGYGYVFALPPAPTVVATDRAEVVLFLPMASPWPWEDVAALMVVIREEALEKALLRPAFFPLPLALVFRLSSLCKPPYLDPCPPPTTSFSRTRHPVKTSSQLSLLDPPTPLWPWAAKGSGGCS